MPTVTVRPTSFVDSGEGGTLAWVNPSNAGASDNAYATVSAAVSGFPLSMWLYCTVLKKSDGSPLAIPVDATNIALTLQIEGHASLALAASYEATMLIDGDLVVGMATQGFFATSDEIKIHPAASDALLTPANLNDSDNGIAFQFQYYNLDGLSTVVGSLDDMQITISYDSATEVSTLAGQWADVTEVDLNPSGVLEVSIPR